jgi:hypothetical protein
MEIHAEDPLNGEKNTCIGRRLGGGRVDMLLGATVDATTKPHGMEEPDFLQYASAVTRRGRHAQ